MRGAQPLIERSAVLSSATPQSFTVHASFAGSYTARIRFTPYWALTAGYGCVEEGAGGWTVVRSPRAGTLKVGIDFSLARVFDHGARCR